MEIEEVKGCILKLLSSLIPPALDAGGPSLLPCPTPPPDLPLLFSFLLSRVCGDDMNSSGALLFEACVQEIMETMFRTLQCDLTQEEFADIVRFKSSHTPSSWYYLGQICSSPNSSHFLCVLERFSQTLSALLSALVSAFLSQSLPLQQSQSTEVTTEPHPFLGMVGVVWQIWEQELISLVMELQLDSEDHQWGHCLRIIGVGLVTGHLRTALGREVGGGNSSGEEVSIFPVLGSHKLLNILYQDFPSALYGKYLTFEKQEVGGAKELVSTLQGGLVLKSVQFLMDSLSTLATVARGYDHSSFMGDVLECAVRLVNKSWLHIHKLSEGVPETSPVQVYYYSLSSLLYLHTKLKKLLLLPSKVQGEELVLTLREQAVALKSTIVHYHRQLCISTLLQHQDTHHWDSTRPFHEGERCSFTVQMWLLHMRGLQHDLSTYLPLDQYCVREEVLVGVVKACLSHLGSRYSQICPSPQRAGLVVADILVILLCVASLIPSLDSAGGSPHSVGVSMDSQSSVDQSSNQLMGVALVVAAPLQRLSDALSQRMEEARGEGGGAWRAFVEAAHQHVLGTSISDNVQNPYLLRPLHPSQHGLLLQCLLADGALLCQQLCRWKEPGLVSNLLQLLALCPHSKWCLAALCKTLASHFQDTNLARESEGSLSDALKMPVVQSVLHKYLSRPLYRHLLNKASLYPDNQQAMEGWSLALLDGLSQEVHAHLPHPLQALLLCVAGGSEDALTDTLAKVLMSALRACDVVRSPSHPCHTLVLPTITCLCCALDPDPTDPNHLQCSSDPDPTDHKLLDPVAWRVLQTHGSKLRKSLNEIIDSSIVDTSPSAVDSDLDPLCLAREEMAGCSFEEHEIAAGLITCDDRGQGLMDKIHTALRVWWSGDRRCCQQPAQGTFNPLREYVNVGTHKEVLVSQEKLINAKSGVTEIIGEGLAAHCSCVPASVIRRVRWEWHQDFSLPQDSAELRKNIDNLLAASVQSTVQSN